MRVSLVFPSPFPHVLSLLTVLITQIVMPVGPMLKNKAGIGKKNKSPRISPHRNNPASILANILPDFFPTRYTVSWDCAVSLCLSPPLYHEHFPFKTAFHLGFKEASLAETELKRRHSLGGRNRIRESSRTQTSQ